MFRKSRYLLQVGLVGALAVTWLAGFQSYAQDVADTGKNGRPEKRFETVALVSVAPVESIASQLREIDRIANGHLPIIADVTKKLAECPKIENALKNGLDSTKPAGLVVQISTDGFGKRVVGFLPTKNADAIRNCAVNELGLEVNGCDEDGLYTVGKENQKIYARPVEGWILFSDESTAFGDIGENPSATLEGLDQEYAVAVRFRPCNVPSSVREMLLLLLNQGLRSAADQCPVKTPEIDAKRDQMIGMIIERCRRAFVETESATFGVKFDSQDGLLFSAVGTAVENSETAEYFGKLAKTQNVLADVVPENAAVAATVTFPVNDQRTEFRRLVLGCLHDYAKSQAEKIAAEASQKIGEEISADQVRTFLDQLFNALRNEVDRAKCEAGFALIAEPERSALVAAVGCDGKAWEPIAGKIWFAAVKAAARKMTDEEKSFLNPETMLETNVAGENGVTVHRISGPEPSAIENKTVADKMVKLFGGKPEMAVTFAPIGAGIVLSRDGVGRTQELLETLNNVNGRPVLAQAYVSLKAFAELFSESAPDDGENKEGKDRARAILEAIGDEPGRISYTVTAEDRTVTTVVRLDLGFLRGLWRGENVAKTE
ncbi:MAG: hypothetical protein Q4C47_07485 [Planctomycetia bacterium]|nr:hypothetical protein [Planctomycetia bacterium]